MTWRRLSMSIAVCTMLALAGCRWPAHPPEADRPVADPPTGSPSSALSPSATGTPSGPSSPPVSPTPASTGLVAFFQVRAVDSAVASEVTTPAQLDRFLAGVPEAGPKVRDAVARNRRTGVRLFAFVLTGCQNDSASLVIQRSRVYAFLTGGVGIQCFVAEHYVAVFAVPAGDIPPNARIG
jgi:hypothetical protein